jgi:hypothetical protein
MNPFHWFVTRINRAYERRIKAASEIEEYGLHHGHAGHHEEEEDEGDVSIANVPRGTRFGHTTDDDQAPANHDSPS